MRDEPTAATEERVARRTALSVIATCFLVVLFDGLDTTSIAFVGPTLTRAWGLQPSALTPAFLATSVGAVLGYMACGPLAHRFGRRPIAFASVLVFGVGSVLTMLAHDVISLAALRLLTALGLGGALPVAIASAVDVLSDRQKGAVAMLVATGLSAGGVLGGLTGGLLLERFGWRSVFLVGGALPLLLLPLIALRIANVKPASMDAAPGGLLIGALFQGRLAVRTTLLWLFSLLVFTGNYAMAFWLPTILIGYGLPTGQATTAAAAYAAGGLVGGLALVAVAARLGIERTLLVAVVFAILCLGVLGLVGMTPAMALPVVIGVGAGIAPCCIGQSALAVSAYPPMLRTTGIGWAAASGRVGSIIGPGVGGLLISASVASDRIFLCAMAPVMAGGIALLLLRHVQRGRVNPGL